MVNGLSRFLFLFLSLLQLAGCDSETLVAQQGKPGSIPGGEGEDSGQGAEHQGGGPAAWSKLALPAGAKAKALRWSGGTLYVQYADAKGGGILAYGGATFSTRLGTNVGLSQFSVAKDGSIWATYGGESSAEAFLVEGGVRRGFAKYASSVFAVSATEAYADAGGIVHHFESGVTSSFPLQNARDASGSARGHARDAGRSPAQESAAGVFGESRCRSRPLARRPSQFPGSRGARGRAAPGGQ